jgi:DNA-binding CsgD family transcriptional regulator
MHRNESSTTDPSLPLEDVRKIVRLLADLAVQPVSLNEKRNALIADLAELIDAEAWIWGISQHSKNGQQPEYACIVKGGFSSDQFARTLEANEHPDMRTLCAPLFEEFSANPRHLTRLRQQIVPDAVYEATDVARIWKQAGVGPVILSFYPLENGGASAIALYRSHDREPFSPRDSRIAHVVLSEVSWLHFDIPDIDTPAYRMGPRLRQVLNLLIQGEPRKDIASQLGISIHTVSGYCKELYNQFNIHSHAELVHRFAHRDGGDHAEAAHSTHPESLPPD